MFISYLPVYDRNFFFPMKSAKVHPSFHAKHRKVKSKWLSVSKAVWYGMVSPIHREIYKAWSPFHFREHELQKSDVLSIPWNQSWKSNRRKYSEQSKLIGIENTVIQYWDTSLRNLSTSRMIPCRHSTQIHQIVNIICMSFVSWTKIPTIASVCTHFSFAELLSTNFL